MQCFISQSVKDVIGIDKNEQNNNGDYALASKTVDALFQNIRVLQIRFKQKCNEAESARKGLPKIYFFKCWNIRL